MANVILIVGPSGSGKSTSGRNLDPEKGIWICPENKMLPFKGAKKNFHNSEKKFGKNFKLPNDEIHSWKSKWSMKSNFVPEDDIKEIIKYLDDIDVFIRNYPEKRKIEYLIIDTLTYAMTKSMTEALDEGGWDKYKRFALEFKQLVDKVKSLPEDLMVVLTAHEDVEESNVDFTRIRQFKVPAGKFTREAFTPEGLFTIVFWAEVNEINENEREYLFRTQSGKGTQAKSPMGMFDELFIDNDLKVIFEKINEYNN